jgi:hypothetical protein
MFSLEEAIPLLAGQRDKGKGRRRKAGSAKAAPRKAANTAGARDRVASGIAKKTEVPKKAGAAKKTGAAKRAGASKKTGTTGSVRQSRPRSSPQSD